MSSSPALSAYLDGALAPAERQELAGHLERCAECVAELGRLRELDRALAAATAPDLSADPGADYWAGFARRVAERTLSASPERPQPARPAGWSFAAGATGMLAAMFLFALLHGSQLAAPLPSATPPAEGLPDGRQVALLAELREKLSRAQDALRLAARPPAPARPADARVLDAAEAALIQLAAARSPAQLRTLQGCLAGSRLPERLRQASLPEVSAALEQVRGAARPATIERLRARAPYLQQLVADRRRGSIDSIAEVGLETR